MNYFIFFFNNEDDMSKAELGDHVQVHYTGRLKGGEQFDTSEGKDPIEFTIGANQVIKGFESGLIGMSEGEKKSLSIDKTEAYGDYRHDLIVKFTKNDFPPDINPEVGKHIELKTQDGKSVNTIIKEIEGEDVYLDANHPLAGEDLQFDVEVVKILKDN
jgi:FKBP-type peptidyl-prolyl cis-trans isomerase 2